MSVLISSLLALAAQLPEGAVVLPEPAPVQSQPAEQEIPVAAPAVAPSASATPKTETVQSGPVEVVGKRRKQGGKIVDASATKLPMTLHETPRAVSVLQSEDLRERNIRTVAQALNYVPGVFTNGSNGSGGYHYKARGYHMPPSVYLVDGFSGVRAGGDYSPGTFGIERVVFLRGPAGLTYGALTVPGGMVNLVTKTPKAKASRQVDLRLGPWGASSVGAGSAASWGLDLDATGTVNGDSSLLYRAVGNLESVAGYTADTRDSAKRFLGSLLWKLDPDGRYTLRPLVQWEQVGRRAGASAVISPTTSQKTNDGITWINFKDLPSGDVNYSAGGRVDVQSTVGADFSARPVDALTLRAAYRWLSYDSDINQWNPVANTLKQTNSADARSWVISRQQSRSITERYSHAYDFNGLWEYQPIDAVRNLLMVGWNGRYSGTNRSLSATGKAHSPINIYTGRTSEALRDTSLTLTPAFLTQTHAWNLYVQDQIGLWQDRFVLTGGLTFAGESNDRDYGPTGILKDTVKNIDAILADKFGGPMPTVGALVQVTKEWAVYGSYGTSFSLAAADAENKSGKTGEFDPATGANLEAGVKYDGQQLSSSVAVFQVEQKGILVQSGEKDLNARGNRYYTQSDNEGRESFGVELTVEARLLEGWNSNLSGAWIDAQVRSSTDSVANGSPVDKTPEWSANWLNSYRFGQGVLKGLGASLNVNWQTERWMSTKTAAAPDPLVMPWTTKVDASVSYQFTNGLDASVSMDNVFDEVIVESGNVGTGLVMGTPRSTSLRVGYSF